MDRLIRETLQNKADEVVLPAAAWERVRRESGIGRDRSIRFWQRYRLSRWLQAAGVVALFGLVIAVGVMRLGPRQQPALREGLHEELVFLEHRLAEQEAVAGDLMQLLALTPVGELGHNQAALQQQRLTDANRLLAPFDYRIEARTEGGFRLSRGGEILLSSFHAFSPVTVAERQSDFIFMAYDPADRYWLVRADGPMEWSSAEVIRHRFQPPVYAGEDLITVRAADDANAYSIWQGERLIRTVELTRPRTGQEVKGLTAWKGQWVLEIAGDVLINGRSLSRQSGFDEVFGWRLLAEKPFYFFRNGSQTGMVYDGILLPYRFDQVLHDGCCEGAALNPRGDEAAIRFYGLRRGVWYWVEVGASPLALAGPTGLGKVRQEAPFPVLVPTQLPKGLASGSPRLRDGKVEIQFRDAGGAEGLLLLTGPAGCCLDADPRKADERIELQRGVAVHYLANQPQFGGPILWWVESGAYIALSGPHRTQAELLAIAESMSPTAELRR